MHIKEVAQESTRPGHPLTFPVREGTYAESCGPVEEGSASSYRILPEPLPTEDGEVVISSQRKLLDDDVPDELLIDYDAPDPGGEGEDDDSQAATEEQHVESHGAGHDRWETQGD